MEGRVGEGGGGGRREMEGWRWDVGGGCINRDGRRGAGEEVAVMWV